MSRLLLLAIVLFAVALAVQLTMLALGTWICAVRDFVDRGREVVFHGVAIFACLSVAGTMTWSDGAGIKFAALVLCVLMPLLAGTLILVVDCFVPDRCFCLGRDCSP